MACLEACVHRCAADPFLLVGGPLKRRHHRRLAGIFDSAKSVCRMADLQTQWVCNLRQAFIFTQIRTSNRSVISTGGVSFFVLRLRLFAESKLKKEDEANGF